MNGAKLQLERVKRYLERITPALATGHADDDLLSFFIQCWSLKDHLKNDANLTPTQRKNVEDDVAGSPALLMCADLANRAKHSTLTSSRLGARIAEKHIRASDNLGSEQTNENPATASHVIVLEDGTRHDALAIAQQAVSEWENLLQKYGL